MDELNEQQKLVVETVRGSVLVLAAAGTGKTRALTRRIAHILESHLAYPDEILAATFTNKAAKEMASRVASLTSVNGMWFGTFHALALRILRQNRIYLDDCIRDFIVFDPSEQNQVLKSVMEKYITKYPAIKVETVMSQIQRWKDRGMFPQDVPDIEIMRKATGVVFKEIYHDYQNKLRSLGAFDFGDLLLMNVDLFKKNPNILERYGNNFKYIMVDEYQDTNAVQYLWLRLLSQFHMNICCVGDDDQSIYSWRGADVGNIMRFQDDFPNTTVIKLELNYRSTSNILGAASGLIRHNNNRMEKTLWTQNGSGATVQLLKFIDAEDEAYNIGRIIQDINSRDTCGEIAILVRTGAQTRVFEESMLRLGLSYRVVHGMKFYDRQEIRDIISYIKLVCNNNNDIAFERIINQPKRGIGTVTLDKIRQHSREHMVSMFVATSQMLEGGIFRGETAKSLSDFLHLFDTFRQDIALGIHPQRIAHDIVMRSGYMDMLRKSDDLSDATRIENLEELLNALSGFNSISEFLEHVTLVTDTDDNQNGSHVVNLMTLHAAKGLEFLYVFLPGWEEGLIPHQRALKSNNLNEIEEERRLAYVGITRAKQKLFISRVRQRAINGNYSTSCVDSRFIKEIPEAYLSRRSEVY